jgi:citrate synthase
MTDRSVTITDNENGKQVDCKVLTGTHGAPVIDISPLNKKLGMFTHDPGFGSTSSCESKITFIDGAKGILLYRGYPIEQLAEHSSYVEVCYLLLNGELPSAAELTGFKRAICMHSLIHEELRRFYSGYRHSAHPMAMLVGVVGANWTCRTRSTATCPRCA